MATSRRRPLFCQPIHISKSSIHHGNKETSDFEAKACRFPSIRMQSKQLASTCPSSQLLHLDVDPHPCPPLSSWCYHPSNWATATEGTRIDRTKQLKDLRHFQCMLASKPWPLGKSYQSYHHGLHFLSPCGTARIVRRQTPPIKGNNKILLYYVQHHTLQPNSPELPINPRFLRKKQTKQLSLPLVSTVTGTISSLNQPFFWASKASG